MRVFGWIGTIFILVFTACFPAKELSVQKVDYNLSQEDSMYVVEISHPKVRGSTAINRLIQQESEENVLAFQEFIQSFPPFAERRLSGTYEVIQNTPQLFSLRQQYEWMVPGVPIILQHFGNVNYDRAAKRALIVKDLFTADSDYETLLKQLITAKIEQQFSEAGCSLYSKETFEDFTLHEKEIHFYLDLYDGAPSCQFEEIGVSYAALDSILAASIKAIVPALSQN